MPLPKRANMEKIGQIYKSDNMKDIKKMLEKATQDLAAAQKANDTARIKRLEQNIANLKGTIERNS